MGKLVLNLAACLVVGLVFFGLGLFRGAVVNDQPMGVAVRDAMIAGGAVASVFAVGVCVFWHRERVDRRGHRDKERA